jgi:hypothetical protein
MNESALDRLEKKLEIKSWRRSNGTQEISKLKKKEHNKLNSQ